MYIPANFIDRLVYIQELADDHLIYYIGSENTVDEGIRRFFKNMDDHGHILIEEPEMIDFIDHDTVIQIIIYKSLPKLEYLEYMYEKRVDKNKNR